MGIHFVKAVQFTRLLKAGDRLREFNFRKVNKPETEEFTVNVCDDKGNRIMFQMNKRDNGWRIGSRELPLWVEQQEKMLHQAIEEELEQL
jgi:hypothetical protein